MVNNQPPLPLTKLPKPNKLLIRGTDMPELLYALLEKATPHGHEKDIHHLFPTEGRIELEGNFLYFIGDKDAVSTMFSSHMDTVHRAPDNLRLEIDMKDYMVYATGSDGHPSILGADDKLGVYVMLLMMENKIPGLYVFHQGEEVGGLGSEYLSQNAKEYFINIKRCVAFDRRGYNSVITEQGDMCCSVAFAAALAKELNQNMPGKYAKLFQFEPDPTGVFTDSANYTDLIPECTNLSIGYHEAHTMHEHFDYLWLQKMFIPAVLATKWDELPTVRTAKQSKYPNSENCRCVKKNRTTLYKKGKDYWGDEYGLHSRGASSNNSNDEFDWQGVTSQTPLSTLPYVNIIEGFPLHSSYSAIDKLIRRALNMYSPDAHYVGLYAVISASHKAVSAVATLRKNKEDVEPIIKGLSAENTYLFNALRRSCAKVHELQAELTVMRAKENKEVPLGDTL